MTSRTRALGATAGGLIVAGFVIVGVTSDGTDATTVGEGLGIAAFALGLAAAALIPALAFWPRPMPLKAISIAAYAFAGLMVLGGIGALTGVGRNDAGQSASSPAPSIAAVAPTSSASPTSVVVTPSPSPSPTATPAATPSPAPTPTPTPTPTPLPTAMTLADARGDHLDENGKPVKKGPPSADIRSVQVATADGRIDFAMDIAAVPPAADPVSHEQLYGWSIDTTDDGTPDWQLLVQNTDAEGEQNAPGWTAALTDLTGGQSYGADAFPGSVDFEGTHLHVGLPLEAIGSPTSRVTVIAYTEDTVFPDPVKHPFKTIQRDDKAPDHQWPDGTDALMIAIP